MDAEDAEPFDLRSDTVTRPTPGMRQAMAEAEVGDDVFDEDPTIHRLQRRVADLLGKEAALFMPSGTMSNQVGLRLHCGLGDAFICEAGCHIYNYEQGAYAQLSGIAAHPVRGVGGVLEVEHLEGITLGGNDHVVNTRLLALENTHNRGGGRILPYPGVLALTNWAREKGLAAHLDGARLFNAVMASGISARRWAEPFDTVSVCFSKGLGAPVGSALAGSKQHIQRARRHRKAFGGAMRQAGVLAAAALYALDHHVQRLVEDHANARRLAASIDACPGLRLASESVDTNMVIFNVEPALGGAMAFCQALKEAGVLMLPISATQIRAVTHLDLTSDAVGRVAEIVTAVAGETAEAKVTASAGRKSNA